MRTASPGSTPATLAIWTRAELPKTLVGKVAYRVLEEEELKKLSETAQEQ